MSGSTTLLPFQPSTMSSAQLAAVSYLARYSGHTHGLYAYQLRQWFAWCESNGLDPLAGIQRAHVELYVRQLGDQGLMDSSVVTMMHAVRGYFRFAHIDGLIPSDPAVYARLPKVHRDELRVRLEHDLLILPVIVDEAEEQSKAAEPGSLFAVALHRVPRRVIGVRPQEHLFLALRIRVHLSRLARSIGEGFQRRTGSS